jgi:hypothetical protein
VRYRYIHEKQFDDGTKALSNIIWDVQGNWSMRRGEFPPDHPSKRFSAEFAALKARGYVVRFLCRDGDRCSLTLKCSQTEEQVLKDLDECLGWDRVSS